MGYLDLVSVIFFTNFGLTDLIEWYWLYFGSALTFKFKMAVQNGYQSHIENQKSGISWYRWDKKSNKVSFTFISGIKNVTEWFLIFSETILTFKSRWLPKSGRWCHIEKREN